jgi:hypothetical protein
MEGSDEEEIQKIKQDIRISGFPLEIKVSSILEKDGWNVRNQVYYTDEEQGKLRTVDIVAHKASFERIGEHDRLNLSLIIECKKSDKPWVFYMTPRGNPDPIDITLLASIKQLSNPDLIKSLPFIRWLQDESHYRREKQEKYAVFSYEPFKKGEGREVLRATYQVTKALKSQIAEFQKAMSMVSMNPIFILYPIIVLDGHLYQSEPQNGEIELRRSNTLQYRISHPKEIFLIDVLESDHLPKFLETINNDIMSLKQSLTG